MDDRSEARSMTGCVERQRVVEVVVKQAREVGETVFLGSELAVPECQAMMQPLGFKQGYKPNRIYT